MGGQPYAPGVEPKLHRRQQGTHSHVSLLWRWQKSPALLGIEPQFFGHPAHHYTNEAIPTHCSTHLTQKTSASKRSAIEKMFLHLRIYIYHSTSLGYNEPVESQVNLRFPIWSFNQRRLTRWLYKRCSVGLRVRSDFSSTLGCCDKFIVVLPNFGEHMLG